MKDERDTFTAPGWSIDVLDGLGAGGGFVKKKRGVLGGASCHE